MTRRVCRVAPLIAMTQEGKPFCRVAAEEKTHPPKREGAKAAEPPGRSREKGRPGNRENERFGEKRPAAVSGG